MNLTILGSSPAVPNPGGASSSYLVQHDGASVLLDCGHGSVGVLGSVSDLRKIDAVLISHMHPDHYFDLVPLKYAYFFGEIPPVPLLLPPGGLTVLRQLQSVIGVRSDFFEASFQVTEFDPVCPLELPGRLHARFAPTQHFVQGFAMRLEASTAPGRSLFYTSDTGWTESMVASAQGATVLLAEATLLTPEAGRELPGHLTAAEAGRLGREAHADVLILTHYWHALAESLQREASTAYGKPVSMAHERDTYAI